MGSAPAHRRLPLATLIVGLSAVLFVLRLGGIGASWLPGVGTMAALYAILALSAGLPDNFPRGSASAIVRRHAFALAVTAVVLLGIAVRLPHLNAELGHTPLDIDENRLAENIRHFFMSGELVHTTVEHYPGAVFWLFSGASFVGYMRVLSSGRAIPPALLPVEWFVGWSRIANIGVAAGIICLTALIGRRVFNAWTGIGAAVLVAVVPLSTATTLVVRNDPGMVLAVLGAVYCALVALDDGRWRWPALGGAAAGLAVGIKYSSVFAIVPVIAAVCCGREPRGRFARAAVASTAFAAAIAITNHFVWSDVPTFLQQLSDQIAITGAGRWSASANPAWTYVQILGGSGGVGMALLVAAAGFAVYALAVPRARNLVFLSFPLLYMWFMTHRPSQFARWVFPLLPFAAVAGAGVLAAIVRHGVPFIASFGRPVRERRAPLDLVLTGAVALLLVWQPLAGAATDVSRRFATPTHTLAERWLARHVQQGQPVLTEEGWLDLGGVAAPVRRVPDLHALLDGGVGACDGAAWVVVPEVDFGHPTLAHLALVQRFHAGQGFGGSTGYDYEIYRLPGAPQ